MAERVRSQESKVLHVSGETKIRLYLLLSCVFEVIEVIFRLGYHLLRQQEDTVLHSRGIGVS